MDRLVNDENVREEDFGFHAERATELSLKAWIALTGNQYPFDPRTCKELCSTSWNEAGAAETAQFRYLTSLTNYAVLYQYHPIVSIP